MKHSSSKVRPSLKLGASSREISFLTELGISEDRCLFERSTVKVYVGAKDGACEKHASRKPRIAEVSLPKEARIVEACYAESRLMEINGSPERCV